MARNENRTYMTLVRRAHIENNKLLPDHRRSDTTDSCTRFFPVVMTTIVVIVPTAIIPFAGDTFTRVHATNVRKYALVTHRCRFPAYGKQLLPR